MSGESRWGSEKQALQEYRRHDGVIGYGFVIESGGVRKHSVVWPDRPAEKYRTQDLIDAEIVPSACEYVMVCDWDVPPYLPPSDMGESDAHPKYELAIENGTAFIQRAPDIVEPPAEELEEPQPAEPEPENAPDWLDRSVSDEENTRRILKDRFDDDPYEIIAEMNRWGIQVSTAEVAAQRNRLISLRQRPLSEGTGGD